MAVYEFEAPSGEVLTREYPLGEAPSLGKAVRIAGQRCKRILSLPQLRVDDVVHISAQLPPRLAKYAEYQVRNKHGVVEGGFRTRRGIDRFEKQTGWRYNR